MGIDYKLASLQAGTDEEYDVPGLVWTILAASAQAEMAVKIDGNLDDVAVELGVDACATILGYKKCGKDLVTGLPIYLISGKFDFSDICSAKRASNATQALS